MPTPTEKPIHQRQRNSNLQQSKQLSHSPTKLMRSDQVCDAFSLNKENRRHFCEVKLFKMNAAMQIDFHGQFPLETVGGISMLQLS